MLLQREIITWQKNLQIPLTGNVFSNANSLIKAGEVYETAERYDDAKEMFLLAYERSPIGRTIVYRLAELAIHVGNYDEAIGVL